MRPCELSREGLIKALDVHERVLKSLGHEARMLDRFMKAPSHWQVIQHAMAMCPMMRDLIAAGKLDRANRWLGFLQGLLWTQGLVSVNELRLINEELIDPEARALPDLRLDR